MAKRVDLGDGNWMDLREDITMAEIEQIVRMGQRWDAQTRQYVDDPMYASIEACGIVVSEWNVDPPCEPTGENLRKMPAKFGMKIQNAIDDYLIELRAESRTGKPPDFGIESES